MPTPDRADAVTLDQARERIAASVFRPDDDAPECGQVGLEPEFLLFHLGADGAPEGRVRLEANGGVLDRMSVVAGSQRRFRRAYGGPPPVYTLDDGGRITFEPGAQVEHSTAIHPGAAAAMADVEETADALLEVFGPADFALCALGIDLWSGLEGVPQQLRAPRYRSMEAYLSERGPEGAVMMRHTASLQVNLDLGPPRVAAARWRVANLACPAATASFAASPMDGAASRRALAWQALDPTRTGFPPTLLADSQPDPGRQYAEFALDADVLLFLGGEAAEAAVPGQAGLRLRDWIAEGHPRHGYPCLADVDYHLTTLFPEVRLRGFLELRSVDAVPRRWRGAVVVFWTGLLYDRDSLAGAEELLVGSGCDLGEWWRSAAREGLAAGSLGPIARDLWDLALEGAGRHPTGFHRDRDLRAAREFRERFVAGGCSPAQELAALHAEHPSRSMAWGREQAGSS
ncbi:MAG: glutamate-cysteine ligase family protein [Planctomycetota bacterium]|jgi:glutamate--cysteine ligase|nr:glutamate-cysteine ligase family protein [Planctomycetota bacterium]MDP6761519.1 glutamate-cysteine ligase family protein [Planctomycetota bacterium]